MSGTVTPGDKVLYAGAEMIVVDVSLAVEPGDQDMAVLREPSDLTLERPVGVPTTGLVITGHLGPGEVEGWVELHDGTWERT